ncbi:MAG: TetR/AcrR family transcriptional regulator [Flavobacteriaceae bacterium]
MKRQQKALLKKEAILQAALTGITEYGFDGVSMKLIAENANVAAGTIYIHFKNKHEMINVLYIDLCEKVNKLMGNNFDKNLDLESNFMNVWKVLLTYYVTQPTVPEFLTQYTYSPYIQTTESTPVALLQPAFDMFEQGVQQGIIKPLPITALIGLAHSPLNSLVRMIKNGRIELSDINISTYAQACWDSIRIHHEKN